LNKGFTPLQLKLAWGALQSQSFKYALCVFNPIGILAGHMPRKFWQAGGGNQETSRYDSGVAHAF
jgi:hypothetical protein